MLLQPILQQGDGSGFGSKIVSPEQFSIIKGGLWSIAILRNSIHQQGNVSVETLPGEIISGEILSNPLVNCQNCPALLIVDYSTALFPDGKTENDLAIAKLNDEGQLEEMASVVMSNEKKVVAQTGQINTQYSLSVR